MSKNLFLLLILLLVLSTTVTSFSANSAIYGDEWSMFHHDPLHTGEGKGSPVLTSTLLWKYTAGNSIVSSPAISGGVVYIGSDDKNLYALNATNGDKIWNFSIGGLVSGGVIPPTVASSPAIDNGVVYIGLA
jgi:outer membrane protein assembly factor BamB